MVKVYVTAICVLAALLVWLQDWGQMAALTSTDFWGFTTLVFLGTAAEHQALSIGPKGGASSIAFLPLLTVVLLFGPAAGVAFYLIMGAIAEYLIRNKPPLKANFNIGQYVVSAALGGIVYSASGGVALMSLPESERAAAILQQFGPFVLYGVVLLVANNAAVAGVIAMSERIPFRDSWHDLVGPSGTNVLLDLLIGPISIAVAALYIQIGPAGLLVSILPLLFIRHSYQTTQQLQIANRDLLKALVKAIETRDPYTSGHSLRVSLLARKIAEHIGLPPRTVERVEMAGLLHDIGKIEAGFAEILRKREALTAAERAIIQSHTTKGEALIRNLSSVPEDVALAVRHHHEREDGTGYPDGLVGDSIPIGAKIIAVCDAVDAMLSDRPYRVALPISAVLQQLRENSGQQFDRQVTNALVGSTILAEYTEIMRATRPELPWSREVAYTPFRSPPSPQPPRRSLRLS